MSFGLAPRWFTLTISEAAEVWGAWSPTRVILKGAIGREQKGAMRKLELPPIRIGLFRVIRDLVESFETEHILRYRGPIWCGFEPLPGASRLGIVIRTTIPYFSGSAV
jgi:hypothetical protein